MDYRFLLTSRSSGPIAIFDTIGDAEVYIKLKTFFRKSTDPRSSADWWCMSDYTLRKVERIKS